MSDYNKDFCFSNVRYIEAKLLPPGWYWQKYEDGSGCLKAPDGNDYMIYDLDTHEYQVTRNSSYDLFPLSYYYADGIELDKFNPFEYMEKEIQRTLIKTNIMDKRLEILDNIKKYQDISKSVPKDFNYDDFGFYLGIKNIKDNIPVEDLGQLMKICYSKSSALINPMHLAEQLTIAVYIREYLSLNDLKKVKYEDVNKILQEDKLYLLSEYSSRSNPQNEKEEPNIEYE